jgi:hypothetical protein
MQIINATPFLAAYAMGLKPDGRELAVVVVKGTFALDPSQTTGTPDRPVPIELSPAAEQVEPVMADVFEGEPGVGVPIYESDFAYFKPKCDVIVHAAAHAPEGKMVEAVEVGLRCAGTIAKRLMVTGPRVWRRGPSGLEPSLPPRFTTAKISYALAFGGVDRPGEAEAKDDPTKHIWFVENPAGIGFHPTYPAGGRPYPSLIAAGEALTKPGGRIRPIALGPIGRAWPPRPKLAGTYDARWKEERFPFLPEDFDERYFQCAPEDQQMPHPVGGEVIELFNLTPAGYTAFRVPKLSMPIRFVRRGDDVHQASAIIDTITIEPVLRRVSFVWRASCPLKRNLIEIKSCEVGEVSRPVVGVTVGGQEGSGSEPDA